MQEAYYISVLYGLAVVTALGALTVYYTRRLVWPLVIWICLAVVYFLCEFAGAAMFIYDPPQGMTVFQQEKVK